MCRCYLTHLPAQQPRAARFLAYGTAPVLQTLHSDPNKSENLSWLLTWADSSCITATYLPKLSPPTQFLTTFQEEEHIFFTFPPGLSHLLSACSTRKKYEIPQLGFTNINKKKCKNHLHFCIIVLPCKMAQPQASLRAYAESVGQDSSQP